MQMNTKQFTECARQYLHHHKLEGDLVVENAAEFANLVTLRLNEKYEPTGKTADGTQISLFKENVSALNMLGSFCPAYAKRVGCDLFANITRNLSFAISDSLNDILEKYRTITFVGTVVRSVRSSWILRHGSFWYANNDEVVQFIREELSKLLCGLHWQRFCSDLPEGQTAMTESALKGFVGVSPLTIVK